jgi:hypothetical protein
MNPKGSPIIHSAGEYADHAVWRSGQYQDRFDSVLKLKDKEQEKAAMEISITMARFRKSFFSCRIRSQSGFLQPGGSVASNARTPLDKCDA